MYKLIEVLKVDANYLFQDAVNIPKKVNDVTFSEYDHIKKYRSLDDHGKNMIDTVLEMECARCVDEYVEIAARGGKYKVKREALVELAKRLKDQPYEVDHDLC